MPLIVIFLSRISFAEETKISDLEHLYGSEDTVSIATGHPLTKNLSPSVTSVITKEDIDRIGARRVTDVLEYLPGVHISAARNGFNVIGFRGGYSEGNQQVLVMINGTPIRNSLFGGKPYVWDMPVKNISHIEVIRGSGSMLYGGTQPVE